MDAKHCLECGSEFFGRADKKFCTDGCRNSFNNKINSNTTNYIRNVNRRLRQNRMILERFNQNGKTTTHRDQLLKAGFDFDFCTNTYVTKENKEYRFCYEHGYLNLNDGYILIVKRDQAHGLN